MVTSNKLPTHIGIIMDGNRTWAKKRNLPPVSGHKQGAKTLTETVKTAKELGIKYLTIYAFSTENWGRAEEEVSGLMNLLRDYLKSDEIQKLNEENVKITILGNKNDPKIPKDVIPSLYEIEDKTKNNDGFYFNICFNYGGRDEIINAIKNIPSEEIKNLTADKFSSYLYTKDMPDPDLVIRTSGQLRTSNFLIWQAAYSELLFIDTLWPDFDKKCLENAIQEYSKRTRKFGKN